MSRRLSRGAALVVALAVAVAAGCYEAPTPDCGFVCGPGDACPDGYTCAVDHVCHRIGAPADLVCGSDAGAPAAPDAGPDAAM